MTLLSFLPKTFLASLAIFGVSSMFNSIDIFAVGPQDNIPKNTQSLINCQPIKGQKNPNKVAEKQKENPLFFLYIRSCPIRKRIGHDKRSWVRILIKISPQTPSDAKHTDPFGCKARQ